MKRLMSGTAAAMVLTLVSMSGVYADTGNGLNNQAAAEFVNLHVPFVENAGQLRDEVAYSTQTRWGAYDITQKGEIILDLRTPGIESGSHGVIRESFEDARITGITGQMAAPTRINYYMGTDPDRWWTDVQAYGVVSLGEIYPDVEVMLRSYGNNVEKLFVLGPGAEPSSISIKVQGASHLDVAGDGRLLLMTSSGPVHFTRPEAYQVIEEDRVEVFAAYRTVDDTYTFEVGPYDPAHELVIDPFISTYLGGDSIDYGNAIAVRGTGDSLRVYVTGSTESDSIPGFAGTYGGGEDIFVASLNAYLTTLLSATYIGGSGDDSGQDLVIQPVTDDIFITGTTNSLNLPGTATTAPGSSSPDPDNQNVFVVHLDEDLQALDTVFATYLGDDEDNLGFAMDMHDVAGTTTDIIYIAGRWSQANNKNAFVTRMATNLAVNTTQYYEGYGGTESAHDVEAYADSAGVVTVYVIGTTTAGTESDVFVAAWDMALGFIDDINVGGPGTTALEFGMAVAVHPSTDDVYIAGGTSEAVYGSIFPGATGAYTSFGGGQDAFIARLPADLSAVVNATYLGGSSVDRAHDLEIYPPDEDGEVYVLGYTRSSNFPDTTGGLQPSGTWETFAARLSSDLSTVNQATYLGGSGTDESMGNCLSISEDCCFTLAFVTGTTGSDDFPGLTNDVVQQYSGGSLDAFVARLDATLSPNIVYADIDVQPRSHDFGDVGPFTPVEVTISNMGGVTLVVSNMSITGSSEFTLDTGGGGDPCGSASLTISAGDSCTVEVSFAPAVAGTHDGTLMILSDDLNEGIVDVSLAATASTLEPDIHLSPTSVAFGTVEVGNSQIGGVSIQNVGSGPLEVSDIAMVSDSNFNYIVGTLSPNCPVPPFSLDSAGICTVIVNFTPVSVGVHSHSITITSDDPDEGTIVVPLGGTGEAGGGGGGGGGGCNTAPVSDELDPWSTAGGILIALLILIIMRRVSVKKMKQDRNFNT